MTRIQYNSEIEYYINDFGDKRYYKIGTYITHRLDGPAIEYANGTKIWFQNGQHHRTDGPAIEYENGTKQYYIHGKYIVFSGTDEEWIIKNLLE